MVRYDLNIADTKNHIFYRYITYIRKLPLSLIREGELSKINLVPIRSHMSLSQFPGIHIRIECKFLLVYRNNRHLLLRHKR